jgi:hypothetical protein
MFTSQESAPLGRTELEGTLPGDNDRYQKSLTLSARGGIVCVIIITGSISLAMAAEMRRILVRAFYLPPTGWPRAEHIPTSPSWDFDHIVTANSGESRSWCAQSDPSARDEHVNLLSK